MISGAVGPGDHEQETTSIYQISILGGAPRKLRGGAFRAELSPDDSLVAYMGMVGDIRLADADGENPRLFVAPGEWEYLGSPTWSSDGKRVVYRRIAAFETTIESRGLDDETSIVLMRDESFRFDGNNGPAFAADFLIVGDRLVYVLPEPAPRSRDQNLWELAIDPDTGKPKGEPRRLTDWTGFRFWTLSATDDGSQLAFMNNQAQLDVHVGELSEGGRRLDDVRRLTLDDRDDVPWCWTPDSRAVVFDSDRYGSTDILVQALDRRDARDLVTGQGEQSGARLTPDGKSLLYWEAEATDGTARRLLRIPVGGGPVERVAEVQGMAFFACASVPEGSCLLFEIDLAARAAITSLLDPVTGKGEELWRLEIRRGLNPKSAVSPDGSRLAVVGHTEKPSIRLLDALTGEVIRDIDVAGLPGYTFQDLAWSPDGSGLYLAGESTRALVLVRVDLDGASYVLREDETGYFSSIRPSPDGRHLAFGKLKLHGNVWMIQQF